MCCEKGAGLGLLLLLQQVEEVVEQGVCVVRAGGGLWVIEGASAGQRNALDDVVVEQMWVTLAEPNGVSNSLCSRRRAGEGETVVLAVIATLPVSDPSPARWCRGGELQLVGVQAERGRDLVAEAIPKNGMSARVPS